MPKKILSDNEIANQTKPGGFNTALCAQALILCNTFWPSITEGFSYTDNTIGTLDCGTCTYMSNQCGWKYVYGGTGGIAWEECTFICTCH